MNRSISFNSTRYIRNYTPTRQALKVFILSTPHGTLGTCEKRMAWLGFRNLSTPHGTLGTRSGQTFMAVVDGLSTPHGTLGTESTAL